MVWIPCLLHIFPKQLPMFLMRTNAVQIFKQIVLHNESGDVDSGDDETNNEHESQQQKTSNNT